MEEGNLREYLKRPNIKADRVALVSDTIQLVVETRIKHIRCWTWHKASNICTT
jgi:hypothetical protein